LCSVSDAKNSERMQCGDDGTRANVSMYIVLSTHSLMALAYRCRGQSSSKTSVYPEL